MHTRRPFLVNRSWILLGAMLLGLAVAPFPHPPASASCAAPYLEAPRQLVLERGAAITVKGRAFVDGCQDTMSCSAVPGCSHCEYDDPPPRPLRDVELRLRQGHRSWLLGAENAATAADNHLGWVTWAFELPAGVRPGPAKLVTAVGGPVGVRIR